MDRVDHRRAVAEHVTEDREGQQGHLGRAHPAHPIKLNLLADVATATAAPDDWLLFIDGDAFPIGDVVAFGRRKLAEFPLLAIQRKENDGDRQPHPSFCLTTVAFWKSIGGDWREDRGWTNDRGETVHDVGGNLLAALEESGSRWYPMLRSNKVDVHPVFFGVYDDLVYHHGAGFRRAWSRADTQRTASEKGLLWSLLPKRLRRLVTRGAAVENERNSADFPRDHAEPGVLPPVHRRVIVMCGGGAGRARARASR